jgi:hypothetical protein
MNTLYSVFTHGACRSFVLWKQNIVQLVGGNFVCIKSVHGRCTPSNYAFYYTDTYYRRRRKHSPKGNHYLQNHYPGKSSFGLVSTPLYERNVYTKTSAAILLSFKFNQHQVWLHHAFPRKLNRMGSDPVSRDLSTDLNENKRAFLFLSRTQ